MESLSIAHGEAAHPSRRRLSRGRWAARSLFVLLLLGAAVAFWRPLFQGNFGVVDPGLVYRAAQPTADLPRLIRAYHIASILNLRGGSFSDPWYASEVRLTRANSVAFYDLPLGATRRPTRRELILLLDVLERTPYPLLIHCKSGSDRTGLAAALYLLCRRGVPPEQALDAFSIKYGHIPMFGPERLHGPLLEYGSWLQASGLAHTPPRFRWWVEHLYETSDRETSIPPLQPGPRPARG